MGRRHVPTIEPLRRIPLSDTAVMLGAADGIVIVTLDNGEWRVSGWPWIGPDDDEWLGGAGGDDPLAAVAMATALLAYADDLGRSD